MTLTIDKDDKTYINGEVRHTEDSSNEGVVFCPQCKAFQTVWFSGGGLMPTRKFFQQGGLIYHDCGSDRPCRIYI